MISKIRSLSTQQWKQVLYSLYLLPYCRLCLRLRGFRSTHASFRPARVPRSDLSMDERIELARRTARAVSIAARYGPYHANCLTRSLVLSYILLKSGIDSNLKFGAGLLQGDLAAHAWLEMEGIVINDREDIAKKYSAFTESLERRWE